MIVYLGRYSTEITTKSKTTRFSLIHRLSHNIKKCLEWHNIKLIDSSFEWDYFFLVTDMDVREYLSFIGGISWFAECKYIPETSLNAAVEFGEKFFKGIVKGKNFAVRARVDHTLNLSKKQVEIELGARLSNYGKVNLDEPEVTCYVDILNNGTFFYDTKEPGRGGFPLSKTRVLHLLSGGFDSPVAAVQLILKGIFPIFLYFDLGNDAQTQSVITTANYIYRKFMAGHNSTLIILPFVHIIEKIKESERSYHNIILKAAFYWCASVFSKKFKCLGFSTGESIGQVSTQTIHNLRVLDMIVSQPWRPLLTFSKEQIIEKARELETYDLAYKGTELCAIQTKHVVTHANKKKLQEELNKLTPHLEEAIKFAQFYDLMKLSKEKAEMHEVELQLTPPFTIIDLRNEAERKNEPIPQALTLDFNTASQKILRHELPYNQNYLVVCKYGTLSSIIATLMQQNEYKATHLPGGLNSSSYQKLIQTLSASNQLSEDR